MMFWTNKQLRERVAQLEEQREMIGNEMSELLSDKKWLESDRISQNQKIKHDKEVLNARNEHINKLTARQKELHKLVRDQLDSDLLLNALKAIGLVEDKNEEPDYQRADQNIRRQQEAHAAAQRQGSNYTSTSRYDILQQAGISSLLGRRF